MAIVLALPVMFIDHTFQVAILVTDLGLKGFRPMVSIRLWPPDIMLLLRKGPFLPTANDILCCYVYRPLAGGVLYSHTPFAVVAFFAIAARALVSPLFFQSWNGWFDFRVFLLLDELPFRANESHLPFYRCRTI